LAKDAVRRLKELNTVFYVYHIRSVPVPSRTYTGFTQDLKQRLLDHHRGCCDFTRPFRPWKLTFYAAFDDEPAARRFEAYLKTGSGIAFARKHLWRVAGSHYP